MTTIINHVATLREMLERKQEQIEMAKHSLSVYESFEDTTSSRTRQNITVEKMSIESFQLETEALEAAIVAMGASDG